VLADGYTDIAYCLFIKLICNFPQIISSVSTDFHGLFRQDDHRPLKNSPLRWEDTGILRGEPSEIFAESKNGRQK
jgi:hypothetical protein